MRRRIGLRSIFIVLLWASVAVHAQPAPAPAHATLEALQRQIVAHEGLARRELARLENRVDTEANRVMLQLDQLFRTSIQQRLAHHYTDVEATLKQVSLPDDVGFLEVLWKQLKTGVGTPQAFEALVTDFIQRAQSKLEAAREQLARAIAEDVKGTLHHELSRAQGNLRAPFQELLAHHFPVWEGHALPAPPLPVSSLPHLREESMPGPGVPTLLGGVAGVLVLILRKRIANAIVNRMARQLAGQLLTKMIPVIGWVLLLIGVWDATQAKTALEQELRTQFIAAYKDEFTINALWRHPSETGKISTRDEFTRDVRELLQAWAHHCRIEVERMLDAARIFAVSPNLRAYITAQERLGRNTQELVEEMNLVGEVFDAAIIAQVPFEQLINMIVQAPDKHELTALARELKEQLWNEYTAHGRAVLVAAHVLGLPTFLDIIRSGQGLQWAEVQRVFETYPRDISEPARRGLLLLWRAGMPAASVPPSTLERLAQHETTFRMLAPLLMSEPRKLLELFAEAQVLAVIEQGTTTHAELTQTLVQVWPVHIWKRYATDAERWRFLFEIARYRLTERRQTADAFASELAAQDEVTALAARAGLDAVRIWDIYVGPQAGEHQRRLAEQAIRLYQAGYPSAALSTPEGISLAALYHNAPVFGLQAYKLLLPLGQAAYLAVLILAVCLVAVPTVWLLRVVRPRAWSQRQAQRARRFQKRAAALDEVPPPDRARSAWEIGGKSVRTLAARSSAALPPTGPALPSGPAGPPVQGGRQADMPSSAPALAQSTTPHVRDVGGA